MKNQSITYSAVGDNYFTKDPIKKLAQQAAKETGKNLPGEVTSTRGESAYVWKQGDIYLASVIEGLGTKNLIADQLGDQYYEIIGHDTVATIINDLVSVGAKPLVVHAYWAVEDNSWLQNQTRMQALIKGWTDACNLAGASWGGGETPTLKGILKENTVELAGSAVGIVKKLITSENLKSGDHIILIKSNGLNANGISLARAVGPTKEMLTKTNIYANLVQDLIDAVDVHYISNITGHGLRKIMRANREFSYILEKVFDPQEIFLTIQKAANLDDSEMYGTFNMGQDYAIFVPADAVEKTQEIIKNNGFESLDAGFVQAGPRKVVIKSKNIEFLGETLDLR